MQFALRKIEQINDQEAQKVFESQQGHIILTHQNGSIQIYQKQEEEISLVKNYQHHQGQIMDVAFAPVNFNSYMVTVSYDRSLNVYDLNNLQEESLFRHQEDDSSIGYFSHVCFCSNNHKELRFLVGTSNGYILDFNSKLNFNPSKHRIFENSISSLAVSPNEQIVVASADQQQKLFSTFSFQTFIEFGQVFADKNKITHLKFNEFNTNKSIDQLIMVSDNNQITLWTCDKEQMEVVKIKDWNLEQKCLDVQWQIGGFSANLIFFDKMQQNLNVFKLRKSYENENDWTLNQVNSE